MVTLPSPHSVVLKIAAGEALAHPQSKAAFSQAF